MITVEKFINVVSGSGDNAEVQRHWYAYNASVIGGYNIFRYDNQDKDLFRKGHMDEHHKHQFDWRTGLEMPGSPVWVGIDDSPTLGEAIQELESWYWEHYSDLRQAD